jgi:hypothetical protein
MSLGFWIAIDATPLPLKLASPSCTLEHCMCISFGGTWCDCSCRYVVRDGDFGVVFRDACGIRISASLCRTIGSALVWTEFQHIFAALHKGLVRGVSRLRRERNCHALRSGIWGIYTDPPSPSGGGREDNAKAHVHAGAYGLPIGGIPPWFRFSLERARGPTPIAQVLTGAGSGFHGACCLLWESRGDSHRLRGTRFRGSGPPVA